MVGQALLHHTSIMKMQIAVITVQDLWLPVAAQGRSDETTMIALSGSQGKAARPGEQQTDITLSCPIVMEASPCASYSFEPTPPGRPE